MKRRDFVSNVIGSGAAAATLSAPQIAMGASRKKYRWRMVMAIPKTLPIWGDHMKRFSKIVKEMTDGKLDIKIYGAGELVPAMECFDAVKSGKVQCAHAASYYWIGKIPAAAFFTSVPFGLSSNGMKAWLQSGGQKLWDELYAPHGVFSLPCGNTGTQMGGWFRKEINSIQDFKGLKMRIPGLGGKVLAKAGGKPILVPGGEIYTNLSTGVIDATEWVGPYHDYTMGFHKVASHYYYPGWHEPGPVLELIINKEEWAKLPKHYQTIVKTAAADVNGAMHMDWLAKDAEYLEKIKNSGKVKVTKFPDSVLKEFKKLSEQVKKETAATSKLAGRIYKSQSEFQALFEKHQNTTETAYSNARTL